LGDGVEAPAGQAPHHCQGREGRSGSLHGDHAGKAGR
jgi:hypothetical protein